MPDIDTIRTRMRDLTAQARRTLSLRDAGAIGGAECLALAGEMREFLIETTTGLLDLADRAEAIGDRRRAEELDYPELDLAEVGDDQDPAFGSDHGAPRVRRKLLEIWTAAAKPPVFVGKK
jgi:hypothetical protein